jgi:ribosomal protein S18 acetylase RimI-like enzyme
MITIRPYAPVRATELNLLTGPYTCTDTYRVTYQDSETGSGFALDLVALAAPHVHRYSHIDDAWVRDNLANADCAYGAFDGERLVGVLIAEKRAWNDSLWVWEFHVAAERRGQGIGRLLMEQATAHAKAAGLRVIICETQNRNSAAIKAYRRLGFRPEGIDISYYTNQDYPDGEVAVFMKRRL